MLQRPEREVVVVVHHRKTEVRGRPGRRVSTPRLFSLDEVVESLVLRAIDNWLVEHPGADDRADVGIDFACHGRYLGADSRKALATPCNTTQRLDWIMHRVAHNARDGSVDVWAYMANHHGSHIHLHRTARTPTNLVQCLDTILAQS